ncbi:hypothetical protein ACWFNE_03640 [Cellulomonas sp. NPDC055163]
MTPRTSTTGTPRRAAALGAVALTLTVGAAGFASTLASADRPAGEVTAGDTAPQAQVDDAVLATDEPAAADALPGADGYTQERSDAFWAAGYVMEDAAALAELWQVELLEAKGRAGQLLLDGRPVPVAPGSSLDLTDPDTVQGLQLEAFWDAGYTGDDGATLADLWNVEVIEAKTTAGQILRDGQPLPIGPSGTPVS